MKNVDAAVATKASDFSHGWYRSTDYNFNPNVALATDDRPDGELIALDAEINRFEKAHEYLTRVNMEADDDGAIDDEMCALTAAQGSMIGKMWSIPATTNAGRQSKARVAFGHIFARDFHSEALHANSAAQRVTELIAELCAMSPLALVHCHSSL